MYHPGHPGYRAGHAAPTPEYSIQLARVREILSLHRIPVLEAEGFSAGDLFAAWWKPNIRNINLLRKRATVSAAEARQGRTSDWVFVAIIIGTLLTLLFGSVALSILFFWYVANNLRLAM